MTLQQLSLFRRGDKSPFWTTAAIEGGFGSFNEGDLLLFSGERLSIKKVTHAIIAKDDKVLHVSALTVETASLNDDFVPWPWLVNLAGGFDHGNA